MTHPDGAAGTEMLLKTIERSPYDMSLVTNNMYTTRLSSPAPNSDLWDGERHQHQTPQPPHNAHPAALQPISTLIIDAFWAPHRLVVVYLLTSRVSKMPNWWWEGKRTIKLLSTTIALSLRTILPTLTHSQQHPPLSTIPNHILSNPNIPHIYIWTHPQTIYNTPW